MSTPSIGSALPHQDDLASQEHARRERAWDPAARWQAIQETMGWVEAQANVRRNTPAACIEQERRRQFAK